MGPRGESGPLGDPRGLPVEANRPRCTLQSRRGCGGGDLRSPPPAPAPPQGPGSPKPHRGVEFSRRPGASALRGACLKREQGLGGGRGGSCRRRVRRLRGRFRRVDQEAPRLADLGAPTPSRPAYQDWEGARDKKLGTEKRLSPALRQLL